MASPRRLLVVDLDGTLLTSDGTVSEASRAALKQLDTAGIDLLVATGRCRNETLDVLESIEYDGPIIVAGGALMTESRTGHTLDRDTLEPPIVERIVSHLHDEGHASLVLKDHHSVGYDYLVVGGSGMHPVSTWWMDVHDLAYREVESIADDPDPDHTLRVGGVGEAPRMTTPAERIQSDVGEDTRMLNWPAVTASHMTGMPIHIVEVFAASVDKWNMTLRHCERHDIDPAHTVAIGDGLNDIGMLRGAATGIAMANAEQQVAEAADVMTESNNEEGFSRAVFRLIHGDIAS